jgi:hypothetical protein
MWSTLTMELCNHPHTLGPQLASMVYNTNHIYLDVDDSTFVFENLVWTTLKL